MGTMLRNRTAPMLRVMVLVLMVAAVCGALLIGCPGCGSEDVTAETTLGMVKGIVDSNDVIVFRGIPYAEPPVGELRYQPPQPSEPWSDTYEASDFGPVCPQPQDEYEDTEVTQSEDCLSLNVWTPGVDNDRRPVMVWIHGGGWTNGSSRDPWCEGSAFAERGDVVVVTINYRLGAFGWLYLADEGGSELASSGNLGLLDQIAALEWVGENISAFGGDPDNITIFGESAGSMSVCTLLGTPSAQGLFHKAIAESGALNTLRNTGYASGITARFMEHAGVSDVDGLQSLTMEEVLQAEIDLMGEEWQSDTLFGPVIDGVVLPEPPLHAIADGSAAGVSLLTGTNLDEVRLWSLYIPGLENISIEVASQFMPWLNEASGDSLVSTAASYKSRRPDATEGDITLAIGTDVLFRIPAIRVVEAQAANQPQTWMYLFTWPTPVDNLGSCHGVELPFVFDLLDAPGVEERLGENPPRELADIMQNTWIAFAREGDPNNEGLPNWPAYETGSRATMQLDLNPVLVEDPYGEDRQEWDGAPFDSVTPSL